MKYYIYAPDYNENSGGCVVLHRLCHLINQVEGAEAYLVPRVPERLSITNFSVFLRDVWKVVRWLRNGSFMSSRFKVNKSWKTPVKLKHEIDDMDNSIVVYPEVTYGNPLNAKNVVRWFLHQPGYFTKQVCFGVNELHYKFNSAIKDFNHCFSTLSNKELKVIYYPLEYYNMSDATNDNGCCHLIRKGKHKKKCHADDSVSIDGLSHQKTAEIFKKSTRFISYDDYTAYSLFAVLCGCQSIVVPSDGVTKEQWYPNQSDRYGIAYGFSENELHLAELTRDKVLEHILKEHQRSFENVINFVVESALFFKCDHKVKGNCKEI